MMLRPSFVLALFLHSSVAISSFPYNSSDSYCTVAAKENGWALLGENDTVATGSCIRVDLASGGNSVIDNEGGKNVGLGTVAAVAVDHTSTKAAHWKANTQGSPLERSMRKIWEQQEELSHFMEEAVADLMEHIGSLRFYLEHPHEQTDQVTHIVSVLRDLESQLADVEKARNFYNLGGWSMLVSLISDRSHQDQGEQDNVYIVQAHAAWAAGTAVMNSEFASWAVEEMWIDEHKTTSLDLMVSQFAATTAETAASLHPSSRNLVNLQHKLIYAVGNTLSGNRLAQAHLAQTGGAALLADRLEWAIQNAVTTAAAVSSPFASASLSSLRNQVKMVKRLLQLVDEIVSDLRRRNGHSTATDRNILLAFSDSAWCSATLSAVQQQQETAVHKTALQTMQSLLPFCGSTWGLAVARQAVMAIDESWRRQVAFCEDIEEREELIHATLEAIDGTQSSFKNK